MKTKLSNGLVLKIIAMPNDGVHPQFYQCNRTGDSWNQEIQSIIKNFMADHEKRSVESVIIRFGSGFFQAGMNEIFYEGAR